MTKFASISFLALAVIFLTACGPIYRTEYAYTPPKTTTAQMCVNQCVQAKTMCEQMCEMRNENCKTRAHQDALYQYEIYKRDQRAHGKHIKKSVSDFDSSYSCHNTCDCTPSYNSCYASCGGQVYEKKVCVAFCGK